MASTYLTPTVITKESLRILHNDLAFARNVNRQYDDYYANTGAKIGSTLTIRKPNKFPIRTGRVMTVSDITEPSTTMTLATQKGVDMNFTMVDLTMTIDQFSKRYIQPAMARLASEVDKDGLAEYVNVYNLVGTAGTTPATALVMLQAQQKLDEFCAPRDENRALIINPAANASLVDGHKALFHQGSTISDQFRRGMVGRGVWGYNEVAMDQNVASLTVGSRALGDTILVNQPTAPSEGATTINIDGGTGSATIKAGDVFTMAGVFAANPETGVSTGSLQQFVCTATNTASGGAWTSVAFLPELRTTGVNKTVTAMPANDAVVTFIGTASTAYPQNIAFHRDAFALVMADLELPQGVHFASRQSYDGISLRIVRQYDINNDQMPCRIDVLYGWKTLRPEWACRVIG